MSMFLRLLNLPNEANNMDIREFFQGFLIPNGGVQIIGGPNNEALIWFVHEADLLRSLELDRKPILGRPVKLLIAKEKGDDNKGPVSTPVNVIPRDDPSKPRLEYSANSSAPRTGATDVWKAYSEPLSRSQPISRHGDGQLHESYAEQSPVTPSLSRSAARPSLSRTPVMPSLSRTPVVPSLSRSGRHSPSEEQHRYKERSSVPYRELPSVPVDTEPPVTAKYSENQKYLDTLLNTIATISRPGAVKPQKRKYPDSPPSPQHGYVTEIEHGQKQFARQLPHSPSRYEAYSKQREWTPSPPPTSSLYRHSSVHEQQHSSEEVLESSTHRYSTVDKKRKYSVSPPPSSYGNYPYLDRHSGYDTIHKKKKLPHTPPGSPPGSPVDETRSYRGKYPYEKKMKSIERSSVDWEKSRNSLSHYPPAGDMKQDEDISRNRDLRGYPSSLKHSEPGALPWLKGEKVRQTEEQKDFEAYQRVLKKRAKIAAESNSSSSSGSSSSSEYEMEKDTQKSYKYNEKPHKKDKKDEHDDDNDDDHDDDVIVVGEIEDDRWRNKGSHSNAERGKVGDRSRSVKSRDRERDRDRKRRSRSRDRGRRQRSRSRSKDRRRRSNSRDRGRKVQSRSRDRERRSARSKSRERKGNHSRERRQCIEKEELDKMAWKRRLTAESTENTEKVHRVSRWDRRDSGKLDKKSSAVTDGTDKILSEKSDKIDGVPMEPLTIERITTEAKKSEEKTENNMKKEKRPVQKISFKVLKTEAVVRAEGGMSWTKGKSIKSFRSGFIVLLNLPCTATTEDVVEFLEDYEIAEAGIVMRTAEKSSTNTSFCDTLNAYVKFVDPDQLIDADALSHKLIHLKPVNVQLVGQTIFERHQKKAQEEKAAELALAQATPPTLEAMQGADVPSVAPFVPLVAPAKAVPTIGPYAAYQQPGPPDGVGGSYESYEQPAITPPYVAPNAYQAYQQTYGLYQAQYGGYQAPSYGPYAAPQAAYGAYPQPSPAGTYPNYLPSVPNAYSMHQPAPPGTIDPYKQSSPSGISSDFQATPPSGTDQVRTALQPETSNPGSVYSVTAAEEPTLSIQSPAVSDQQPCDPSQVGYPTSDGSQQLASTGVELQDTILGYDPFMKEESEPEPESDESGFPTLIDHSKFYLRLTKVPNHHSACAVKTKYGHSVGAILGFSIASNNIAFVVFTRKYLRDRTCRSDKKTDGITVEAAHRQLSRLLEDGGTIYVSNKSGIDRQLTQEEAETMGIKTVPKTLRERHRKPTGFPTYINTKVFYLEFKNTDLKSNACTLASSYLGCTGAIIGYHNKSCKYASFTCLVFEKMKDRDRVCINPGERINACKISVKQAHDNLFDLDQNGGIIYISTTIGYDRILAEHEAIEMGIKKKAPRDLKRKLDAYYLELTDLIATCTAYDIWERFGILEGNVADVLLVRKYNQSGHSLSVSAFVSFDTDEARSNAILTHFPKGKKVSKSAAYHYLSSLGDNFEILEATESRVDRKLPQSERIMLGTLGDLDNETAQKLVHEKVLQGAKASEKQAPRDLSPSSEAWYMELTSLLPDISACDVWTKVGLLSSEENATVTDVLLVREKVEGGEYTFKSAFVAFKTMRERNNVAKKQFNVQLYNKSTAHQYLSSLDDNHQIWERCEQKNRQLTPQERRQLGAVGTMKAKDQIKSKPGPKMSRFADTTHMPGLCTLPPPGMAPFQPLSTPPTDVFKIPQAPGPVGAFKRPLKPVPAKKVTSSFPTYVGKQRYYLGIRRLPNSPQAHKLLTMFAGSAQGVILGYRGKTGNEAFAVFDQDSERNAARKANGNTYKIAIKTAHALLAKLEEENGLIYVSSQNTDRLLTYAEGVAIGIKKKTQDPRDLSTVPEAWYIELIDLPANYSACDVWSNVVTPDDNATDVLVVHERKEGKSTFKSAFVAFKTVRERNKVANKHSNVKKHSKTAAHLYLCSLDDKHLIWEMYEQKNRCLTRHERMILGTLDNTKIKPPTTSATPVVAKSKALAATKPPPNVMNQDHALLKQSTSPTFPNGGTTSAPDQTEGLRESAQHTTKCLSMDQSTIRSDISVEGAATSDIKNVDPGIYPIASDAAVDQTETAIPEDFTEDVDLSSLCPTEESETTDPEEDENTKYYLVDSISSDPEEDNDTKNYYIIDALNESEMDSEPICKTTEQSQSMMTSDTAGQMKVAVNDDLTNQDMPTDQDKTGTPPTDPDTSNEACTVFSEVNNEESSLSTMSFELECKSQTGPSEDTSIKLEEEHRPCPPCQAPTDLALPNNLVEKTESAMSIEFDEKSKTASCNRDKSSDSGTEVDLTEETGPTDSTMKCETLDLTRDAINVGESNIAANLTITQPASVMIDGMCLSEPTIACDLAGEVISVTESAYVSEMDTLATSIEASHPTTPVYLADPVNSSKNSAQPDIPSTDAKELSEVKMMAVKLMDPDSSKVDTLASTKSNQDTKSIDLADPVKPSIASDRPAATTANVIDTSESSLAVNLVDRDSSKMATSTAPPEASYSTTPIDLADPVQSSIISAPADIPTTGAKDLSKPSMAVSLMTADISMVDTSTSTESIQDTTSIDLANAVKLSIASDTDATTADTKDTGEINAVTLLDKDRKIDPPTVQTESNQVKTPIVLADPVKSIMTSDPMETTTTDAKDTPESSLTVNMTEKDNNKMNIFTAPIESSQGTTPVDLTDSVNSSITNDSTDATMIEAKDICRPSVMVSVTRTAGSMMNTSTFQTRSSQGTTPIDLLDPFKSNIMGDSTDIPSTGAKDLSEVKMDVNLLDTDVSKMDTSASTESCQDPRCINLADPVESTIASDSPAATTTDVKETSESSLAVNLMDRDSSKMATPTAPTEASHPTTPINMAQPVRSSIGSDSTDITIREAKDICEPIVMVNMTEPDTSKIDTSSAQTELSQETTSIVLPDPVKIGIDSNPTDITTIEANSIYEPSVMVNMTETGSSKMGTLNFQTESCQGSTPILLTDPVKSSIASDSTDTTVIEAKEIYEPSVMANVTEMDNSKMDTTTAPTESCQETTSVDLSDSVKSGVGSDSTDITTIDAKDICEPCLMVNMTETGSSKMDTSTSQTESSQVTTSIDLPDPAKSSTTSDSTDINTTDGTDICEPSMMVNMTVTDSSKVDTTTAPTESSQEITSIHLPDPVKSSIGSDSTDNTTIDAKDICEPRVMVNVTDIGSSKRDASTESSQDATSIVLADPVKSGITNDPEGPEHECTMTETIGQSKTTAAPDLEAMEKSTPITRLRSWGNKSAKIAETKDPSQAVGTTDQSESTQKQTELPSSSESRTPTKSLKAQAKVSKPTPPTEPVEQRVTRRSLRSRVQK